MPRSKQHLALALITLSSALVATAQAQAPAISEKVKVIQPPAPTAGRPVTIASKVNKVQFMTKLREDKFTFANTDKLGVSSPQALANGRATFTTSKPGFVNLTLPGGTNLAYGVTCETTSTPSVRVERSTETKDVPGTRDFLYIHHEQNGSASLGKFESLKATAPRSCNAATQHIVGHPSGRSIRYSCEEIRRLPMDKHQETPLSWKVASIEGAVPRPVQDGSVDQPWAFVEPSSANPVNLRITYDTAGKKIETARYKESTIANNGDARDFARYPRVVQENFDTIQTGDVQWTLQSCTVTTYSTSKKLRRPRTAGHPAPVAQEKKNQAPGRA